MPLSRHSLGTNQEMSPHATRQGTLGHSRLSLLSHCGLILAKEWNLCARANPHFKKKENEERRQRMNCRTLSQNPCMQGRSHSYMPSKAFHRESWLYLSSLWFMHLLRYLSKLEMHILSGKQPQRATTSASRQTFHPPGGQRQDDRHPAGHRLTHQAHCVLVLWQPANYPRGQTWS